MSFQGFQPGQNMQGIDISKILGQLGNQGIQPQVIHANGQGGQNVMEQIYNQYPHLRQGAGADEGSYAGNIAEPEVPEIIPARHIQQPSGLEDVRSSSQQVAQLNIPGQQPFQIGLSTTPRVVNNSPPAWQSIPDNVSHNRMAEFRAWQAARGYDNTGGAGAQQTAQIAGSGSAMERFRQWQAENHPENFAAWNNGQADATQPIAPLNGLSQADLLTIQNSLNGAQLTAQGMMNGEVPLPLQSDDGGIMFDVGYYLVYFIVLSIAFAIVRNLFGRIYNRLNTGEKPIDWGKRFRRVTNEDDAPKQQYKDLKEGFNVESDNGNDQLGGDDESATPSVVPKNNSSNPASAGNGPYKRASRLGGGGNVGPSDSHRYDDSNAGSTDESSSIELSDKLIMNPSSSQSIQTKPTIGSLGEQAKNVASSAVKSATKGISKFYESRKQKMEDDKSQVEVKASYDYQTLAGDQNDDVVEQIDSTTSPRHNKSILQSAKSMMGMGEGSKYQPVKGKSLDIEPTDDNEEAKQSAEEGQQIENINTFNINDTPTVGDIVSELDRIIDLDAEQAQLKTLLDEGLTENL